MAGNVFQNKDILAKTSSGELVAKGEVVFVDGDDLTVEKRLILYYYLSAGYITLLLKNQLKIQRGI